MAAFFGGYGNRHGALLAIFHGDRRRRLGHPAIDDAHHHENGEGHDQKVDHRINEIAVIEGGLAGSLRGLKSVEMRAAQVDKESGKIDLSEQLAHRWQKDVVHKRSNDFSESGADDDADGEVQNTAAHCEFLEFFEHDSSPLEDASEKTAVRRQVFPRAEGSVECPAL